LEPCNLPSAHLTPLAVRYPTVIVTVDKKTQGESDRFCDTFFMGSVRLSHETDDVLADDEGSSSRRRRRIAHVYRPLRPHDDEVIDEPSVPGQRLSPHSCRCRDEIVGGYFRNKPLDAPH